jgi:P27 family predicted phage terminase small subunit
MVKGRKPRAVEVSEASGAWKKNPSRRPNNIIKGDPELPSPPAFVKKDKIAMACWSETVDILQNTGILSRTDSHLLARYAITYAEWQRCAMYIQKFGHRDDNGKTSSESTAFFKLATEHTKLVAELGLTPSSRARLSVASSEPYDAKSNSDLRAYLKAVKDGGG